MIPSDKCCTFFSIVDKNGQPTICRFRDGLCEVVDTIILDATNLVNLAHCIKLVNS